MVIYTQHVDEYNQSKNRLCGNWNEGVESAVKRTETGYAIEASLPLTEGGKKGRIIGFDLMINDDSRINTRFWAVYTLGIVLYDIVTKYFRERPVHKCLGGREG